jgi:hypothetical protein
MDVDEMKKIAEQINNGEIENLADIDWCSSDFYSIQGIETFIDLIKDRRLRPLVIEAVLFQFKYDCKYNDIEAFVDTGFEAFCSDLYGHIQGSFKFDLEAFRARESDRLQQLEKRVNTLEDAVFPRIIPAAVLPGLQQAGFIENAEAQPLKWIKSNSTTHGQIPNKKSLLDLLCLLKVPDDTIKDRKLLNSLFIFQNDKPLAAQNYTDLTDNKGQIKRPIVSEYHNELEQIINKSKEK